MEEVLWKIEIKWLGTHNLKHLNYCDRQAELNKSSKISILRGRRKKEIKPLELFSHYRLHTKNCGLPSCNLSSSRSASAKPWLISSSSAWRRLYSMWSLSNSLLYSSLSCSLMMGGYSLRAWQHRIQVEEKCDKSDTDYLVTNAEYL